MVSRRVTRKAVRDAACETLHSAELSCPNATDHDEIYEGAPDEVDEAPAQNSTKSKRGCAKRSEKPTCGICGKTFASKQYITVHMKFHRGEKPCECDVCGKRFALVNSLKTHRRLRTTERPFSCDLCGYVCNTSSALQILKRTHTGEKPYVCDVCEKGFTTLSALKTHEQIHTAGKPFECVSCGRTFSLINYLRTHEKRHSGVKQFVCDICGRRFTENAAVATGCHLYPFVASSSGDLRFFIVNVDSETFCGSGDCGFYDCCVGKKYGDFAWSPLVRCFDIDYYFSNFHVIVNETNPRIEMPLLFRPRNESNPHECDDWPAMYNLDIVPFHPDNHCFDGRLPDCKEMPVIEFGTESCKVQMTIGCGNHTGDDPVMCNYDDDEELKYANGWYRINGLEFLSLGLGYNATSSGTYLVPQCSTVAEPRCHKPVACDFDPDKDGYAPDFYVELNNKPGCVSVIYFGGCPGIVPVKVNATEVP